MADKFNQVILNQFGYQTKIVNGQCFARIDRDNTNNHVGVVKHYVAPESGKPYVHVEWIGEPPKDGERLYLK